MYAKRQSMMNYSSEMSIGLCYFFLFIAVLIDHGVGLNCTESRCGSNGPEVRFPFRIKNKQPDNCGYPGFDVSCTEKNDTVLELPNSVKFYIKKINYTSQLIYAIDPQGCFPRQRLNFNLTASPFHVPDIHNYDVALFNCSSGERSQGRQIPCLSTPNNQVYAFESYYFISTVDLLSCTKMYNMLSVPPEMLEQNNYSTLQLAWTNPKCGSCEAKGGHCGWRQNTTKPQIGCYGLHKQTKDASRKLLIAGVVVGLFLVIAAVIAFYRIYSSNKTEKEYQVKIERFLDDYKALKPARYSYADLKRITNQFKDELGQGTYGTVFKGKLSNEILVAVKVLVNSKGNGEEFVNEVGTMGRIHHVNVVRLIGYCADGFRRALVYEYLPNDSLQKFISSGRTSADATNQFLGWKNLQDIALGIAKGIEYLHQGCDQRILHFDIKPQNILLDNDFNPKISDFGLAKLCSKDKSAVSMTTARGTIGYIAPEVFSRNFGSVSCKSDVYSFGMLVLEMVGGRKNVDATVENGDQIYFPEWIYNLLEEGDLRFNIEEEEDAKLAKKLAIVGLWCIQWNPVDRPSMKVVVQKLEGEGGDLTKPPNPFNSTAPRTMNTNTPGKRLHQELPVISEIEES